MQQALYKPLNEEDVMKARFDLLSPGEYDGVIRECYRKPSSAGNIMAEMNVHIIDEFGLEFSIRDYLVFTPKCLWKIKHFCDSSGQQEIYEKGTFIPELADKQKVRILIGIKKGDEIPEHKLGDRDPGSKYPDKNYIVDYLPKIAKKDNEKVDFKDDDILY